MYYVNEHIRDTVRIFPEQGRGDYLRLDMNENPEGLPKAFVDEVLGEITPEFLATYPEPNVFMEKYAAYLEDLQKESQQFYALVDNAFAPNFRDAFLHSILLAKTVGVKEEEILASTEDIDSFFLD